jgi:hypothetical protein
MGKGGWHMKLPDPSEDQIQVAVAEYLTLALPVEVWWSSIEHRTWSAREGANRKKRGVKPGVPDLLICWHGQIFGIELKTRTGHLSQGQIEQRAALLRAGARWALCRSLDDVIDKLREWEIPMRMEVR